MAPAEWAAVAAWVSASIALLALVAVILFGVLNLRRARLGPQGSPRWALEPASGSRTDLVNTGNADATNVEVEIDGIRTGGTSSFETFAAGQRAGFLVTRSLGSGQPTIVVKYDVRVGRSVQRREWQSDLPLH